MQLKLAALVLGFRDPQSAKRPTDASVQQSNRAAPISGTPMRGRPIWLLRNHNTPHRQDPGCSAPLFPET